jgi:hypothetical protein
MNTAPKSKRRSGGNSSANRQNPKNGNSKSNNSREPTEQEMVMFQSLLRGQNATAKAAHSEFSASQDKSQFYRDIISLCRQPPSHSASSTVAPSATVKSTTTSTSSSNVASTSTPSASVVAEQAVPPSSSGIAVLDDPPPRTATAEKPPPRKAGPRPAKGASSGGKVSTAVPPVAAKEKPTCSFLSKHGSCRKGKKCRFLHPGARMEGSRWVAAAGTKDDTDTDTTKTDVSSVHTTDGADVSAPVPVVSAPPAVSVSSSSSSSSADDERGEIPRNNSVDNAMGLMDMDLKYLEENLDMRLEDKSPSSEEGAAAAGGGGSEGELWTAACYLHIASCVR